MSRVAFLQRNCAVRDGLEEYLRETHADQGGEATFEEWVWATINDPADAWHHEAIVFDRCNQGTYT